MASEQSATITILPKTIVLRFCLVNLATTSARATRLVCKRRQGRFKLKYDRGKSGIAPLDTALLEACRENGIPHAAVYGGRSQCSTYRVQTNAPDENLLPPNEDEARVLRQINSTGGVQLGCQARPTDDVPSRIFLPTGVKSDTAKHVKGFQGRHGKILSAFVVDFLGFFHFSKEKTVLSRNSPAEPIYQRYGEAFEKNGDRLNRYMGGGIIALFGLDSSSEAAACDALRSAGEMFERLERMKIVMITGLPTYSDGRLTLRRWKHCRRIRTRLCKRCDRPRGRCEHGQPIGEYDQKMRATLVMPQEVMALGVEQRGDAEADGAMCAAESSPSRSAP